MARNDEMPAFNFIFFYNCLNESVSFGPSAPWLASLDVAYRRKYHDDGDMFLVYQTHYAYDER